MMMMMMYNTWWLKHKTACTIRTHLYAIPLTIKTLMWNKIIDTKYGWHNYIQCEIDDIDIDQLMTDRAESHQEGMNETYD